MTENQGASANEKMLYFCRQDQENDLEELLENEECNVSHTDGAGNTAAHHAAKAGSIGCLELLVNHPDIDLNIKNSLYGETPLHIAVKYADHEMACCMVKLLIDGGADTEIRNTSKLTPAMLVVDPKYQDIKDMLEEASVAKDLDESDIANESDVDDDGSTSESD